MLALGSLAVVAAVNACAPHDEPTPVVESDAAADSGSTVDAAPTSSVGPDSGPDANIVCNALTTEGAPVAKIVGVADAAPTPLGGTIEDGDYVAEGTTVYEFANFPAIDAGLYKMKVSGGVVQVVLNNSSDRSTPDRTQTEMWSVSGTNVTITRTCPTAKAAEVRPYTVQKDKGVTTLILFGKDQGKTIGVKFLKQ